MVIFTKFNGHTSDGVRLYRDMGKGDSTPAPDYTALAAASAKAADVTEKLGTRQMDMAQAQYDQNMAVAKPVIDAQTKIMNQTADQGQDYYNYNKDTYRPLEQGLVADAQNYDTEGKQQQLADKAAADVAQAQSNQEAQLERGMSASGVNPNSGRFMGLKRAMAIEGAAQTAGAMTGARQQAEALGYAKKMDAAGLGRNLSNASTGAYSVATNAGNSAVGNQLGTSGQLLSGTASGAGTIAQGQGMNIQGLSSVLGAQTSAYNAGLSSAGSEMGGLGSVLGGAAALKMAFASDKRLKKDIEFVGVDDKTGLNIYEWAYKDDEQMRRYQGVMADEVIEVVPDAVVFGDDGYMRVNYDMLGIKMVEV